MSIIVPYTNGYAVACLYCGKEIGPIRLIRDSEFCSTDHRTRYRQRLRKVLTQVGEPEARSTGLAPFIDASKAQDGSPRSFAPSLSFRFAVRIPLDWPLTTTPIQGSGFAPIMGSGAVDASPGLALGPATASYCSFDNTGLNARTELPAALLGRAIPDAANSPAAIAPDSRTDALETSPANTWLAPCPPLQTPTELPPVRGVSGLREHPLASPISISYSIAYRSTRSTSLAESNLSQGDRSSPALPELQLDPLPSEQILEALRPLVARGQVEEFASSPAAVPAASFIETATQGPLMAQYAPFVPKGPRLAAVTFPTPSGLTIPLPTAEAVEDFVQPSTSMAFLGNAAVVELPEITALHPLGMFEPSTSSAWMPPLESQPAARLVRTAEAAAQEFAPRPIALAEFQIPLAQAVQSGEQTTLGESFPVPAPVPVEAAPTAAAHVPVAISLTPVRMGAFAIQAVGGSPVAAAGFLEGLAPIPVEAARTAPELVPAAIATQPVLSLPTPQMAPDLRQPACGNAGFERQTAAASIPPTHVVHRSAALEPVLAAKSLVVPFQAAAAAPVIPSSPAAVIATPATNIKSLPLTAPKWFSRQLDLELPRLGLRPVFERFETFVDLAALERKRQSVFDIGDYEQLRKHKPVLQHAGKAIAASLLVGVALWFGAHAANLGRRIVSRDASSELAAIESSARAASSGAAPHSSHFITPVAWAKEAIAKRAAVQVTDSFEEGMRAWGAAAKNMAPGWTRNADGYVNPGKMALLQPTLAYTDYRLEFFGLIEKKGMSWAVRARDPNNYYAMKFKVVEPGLRPVLSMVHYAVVDGKPGQKTEVPLSVMVHNDTAYHVAVQVRGHQYTASIEGQEVESWMDDALPSGGVGFFSEAGERARLYWMKVSKNDDWLGRVCAYLSGSSVEDSQETAWLKRQQPAGPAPSRRDPVQSEVVLVADGAGEFSFERPQRNAPRLSTQGRNRLWNS